MSSTRSLQYTRASMHDYIAHVMHTVISLIASGPTLKLPGYM